MIWPEEWWFKSLGIQRLWEKLGRGEGATVAIWDSGLDNGFHFLAENRAVGKNYLSDQVSTDFKDGRYLRHGSELARLIAAEGDHWGIAPGCALRIVRGADEPRWSDFDVFLNDPAFADVDVVNVSHAFLPSNPAHANVVASMQRAIPGSSKLFVAAAGNYGWGQTPLVTIPACIGGVVSVNATQNEQHVLWRDSTHAQQVTLAVPGANLNGYYSKTLNGTSFSCAVVSGICALLIGALRRMGRAHDAGTIRAHIERACLSKPGWNSALYGKCVFNAETLLANLKLLP